MRHWWLVNQLSENSLEMAVQINIPFDILIQDVEEAGVEVLHLRLLLEMLKVVLSEYTKLWEKVVACWCN